MAKKDTWKDVEKGATITRPGSAREYKTGDWRSQRPVYDQNRCIKCGVCYLYCPDAAIKIRPDGFIEIDEYYCKGCGICSRECITGAFKMVPEGKEEAKKK